ncbi:MAG: aminotransferase class I/II-fold pyridoxal phosphate-dependent enzyme [Cetobacterium sp.]
MLAKESKVKEIHDKVFESANKAKEASKKYGVENVINATIGSLYDEKEKLVTFNKVVEVYKNICSEDIFGYGAGITGTEDYKEAVKRVVLGENYSNVFNENYLDVVATPGGTGAISNTMKNYLNRGEKVLLPNLMWDSYKLIAEEVGGSHQTYNLFNEKGEFDIEDFKNQVFNLISVQESLVVIIKEASEKKHVILINDIAYIDFDERDEKEKDEYRFLFKDLPKNLLTIFIFSMSKSFTSYGLRVGAQLALSSDENVIKDFEKASKFSCRTLWSNVSRGGMKMFSEIVLNKDHYEDLQKERNEYITLIRERAGIFLKEANDVKLETYNYKSGFFITIPIKENIKEVVKNLEANHIYTVVLDSSVRVALCSINKGKVKGLAKKIKDCINKVN